MGRTSDAEEVSNCSFREDGPRVQVEATGAQRSGRSLEMGRQPISCKCCLHTAACRILVVGLQSHIEHTGLCPRPLSLSWQQIQGRRASSHLLIECPGDTLKPKTKPGGPQVQRHLLTSTLDVQPTVGGECGL